MMLSRFVTVVIILPIALLLIALAVANRAAVPVTFDPFNPGNPALTLSLPLFVPVFLAAAVGLVLGSFVTWWKQGHYRKLARQRSVDAAPPPPRSETGRAAAPAPSSGDRLPLPGPAA